MHGLQTIIKNDQKAVDKHLEEAEKANQGKLFPSTKAQDEALDEIKRQDG